VIINDSQVVNINDQGIEDCEKVVEVQAVSVEGWRAEPSGGVTTCASSDYTHTWIHWMRQAFYMHDIPSGSDFHLRFLQLPMASLKDWAIAITATMTPSSMMPTPGSAPKWFVGNLTGRER